MKHLKVFETNNNYPGFYIIGWGLAGGFGGADTYEVIKAKDLDQASSEAFERACEEYESYVGMHGLRSMEEIMEEDGLDGEEAEYTYNDERESWLDYSAEPYSKEYEKKVSVYHYENRYKDILSK